MTIGFHVTDTVFNEMFNAISTTLTAFSNAVWAGITDVASYGEQAATSFGGAIFRLFGGGSGSSHSSIAAPTSPMMLDQHSWIPEGVSQISFKSIICKALIVGVGTFISLSGAAYCFFPYPSLRPFSGPPPFLAFGANVGTGFFIGSNGDIVTNLHVVNSCRRITISGYRFQAKESELAASDPDMDLALLHTKALPPSILPIAEGYWPIGSVKQVDAAMLALTPQESGKAITIGYHMLRTSAQVDPIQLSLTAHSHDRQHWYRLVHGFFQPGQSGSPIIYTSGKVAGVLSDIEDGTKWQSNIGLFIPGPIVRNFALSAGVVLPTVVNESPERAVVHIFCFTTLP